MIEEIRRRLIIMRKEMKSRKLLTEYTRGYVECIDDTQYMIRKVLRNEGRRGKQKQYKGNGKLQLAEKQLGIG